MALFTETEVRNRAKDEIRKSITKSANEIILAESKKFSRYATYDIFLSHSLRDAELILGIKAIFEDAGYKVYVDWIDDPQLDRSSVTKDTAAKLKERMNTSKSLFYVTTENSTNSKWMPWECGYFDGLKEKVAIVPIKKTYSDDFYGQEYLGLYPHCTKEKSSALNNGIWIYKDNKQYVSYDYWVITPNHKIEWKVKSWK